MSIFELIFELTSMAAKTKVTRLESEIEKCRAEANWAKALDLGRQMSTKSQTLGKVKVSV